LHGLIARPCLSAPQWGAVIHLIFPLVQFGLIHLGVLGRLFLPLSGRISSSLSCFLEVRMFFVPSGLPPLFRTPRSKPAAGFSIDDRLEAMSSTKRAFSGGRRTIGHITRFR